MNRFLNVVIVFYSVEKRFYSVENLVEKPVGEQDKTHEFSPSIYAKLFNLLGVHSLSKCLIKPYQKAIS